MDINDNQQINSFVKGMNTDVSDSLMDSSQYRYAENVRLVTNTDSNSGELRLIEGVYKNDGWTTKALKAMTSIRNILIVVSQDDKIYKKDTSDPEADWVLIFQPNEGEHFGDYLSLVTRWETDNLVKLYIADGEHQLMYININDSRFQNIDNPIEGFDNIYAIVEEPLDALSVKVSESVGTIPPAKVQYAYRYYKLGGAATQLSPLSNILALYKSQNEGYPFDEEHSNKAVDITIPDSPSPDWLNRIQIFRIVYRQIGQLPQVSLIYDNTMPVNNIYTDTGYDIESSTLEDLLSYINMSITPKVIESKNDYLFAANVKYNDSDFEKYLDENNVSENVKAPSSGCAADGHNIQFDGSNILNYDKELWKDPIEAEAGFTVYGGSGYWVKWEYEIQRFYSTLDNKKTIVDKSDSPSPTTVRKVIQEQYPSLRHGEVYRYGMVLYNKKGQRSSVKWIADIMAPSLDDTITVIGQDVSRHNDVPRMHYNLNDAFLQKYELHRVGIKFTIKSDFWNQLEDVVAVEIVRAERTSSDKVCLTQGIIGLPYRVYKRNGEGSPFKETQYLCHPGFFSTNHVTASSEEGDEDERRRSKGDTNTNYLMFASPEICYQPDDIKSLLDTKRNNLHICPAYRNINYCYPLDNEYEEDTKCVQIHTTPLFDTSRFTADRYAPVFEQYDDDNSFKYTKQAGSLGISQVLGHYMVEQIRQLFEAEISSSDKFRNFSTYHCAPYTRPIDPKLKWSPIQISKYAINTTEDASSFFIGEEDENVCTADKAFTTMDGDMFMHWTNPMLIGYDYAYGDMANGDTFDAEHWNRYVVYYPVGSVGRCMIMRLDSPFSYDQTESIDGWPTKNMCFQTADIKTETIPYGGISTISVGNYLSFGNIVHREESQGGIVPYNDVDISVFDGDCYPGIFNYAAVHAWHEANMPCGVRLSGFYSVPIESDIDLSATCGDLYVNYGSGEGYYLQDKKSVISNIFTQGKDMYEYNTAYGAMPTAIEYSAVSFSEIDTDIYDTRIHHSELKTNGEHIDNWLMFRANNFIDVDTRFGQITNMRLFKDNLLYWQENATGIVSSNERTVLNDIDHNQIVLGTGGVLQRFDYISTLYGMKPNQYEAEIQSNTTQYWWDGYNKEILGYSGGMELVPLAKVKNCSNYINKYNEMAHPSLSYDPKFNELISNVVNKGSIVYNENVQQFTSVYTFHPIFRAITQDVLHLTSMNNIYQWNRQEDETVSVLFEESYYTDAKPKVQYVVNKGNGYNKVFDITTFGGRFYGGDEGGVDKLTFKFDTPLKQHSQCTGSDFITNREYDFRLAIPRNNDDYYGGRMRGKTMQCELSSSSNSTDFSLQYIITKYRMSWS